MRRVAAIMVIGVLALSAAACGSSGGGSASSGSGSAQNSQAAGGSKVHLAKTKFVLHAGLAFGAFHRYIYKPFKTGALQSAHGIHKALVYGKAALAGLFAYHEVKLALHDAQSSRLLSKLVSPLTALGDRLRTLSAGLKGHDASPAQISATNGQIGGIRQLSARNGAPITDQTPTSLTAAG